MKQLSGALGTGSFPQSKARPTAAAAVRLSRTLQVTASHERRPRGPETQRLCPAERHSAREFMATPDPPELAQANTELVTRPGSALRPGYERAPLLQDPSDRRPHRFLTCSAEDVSLTHAHTRVHTNAHTHTHVHTHRSGGAQWPPRRGVDTRACCPRALRPAAPAVKAGGLQRTQ